MSHATKPIGKVTFTHPLEPHRPLTATLGADRRWTCDDADLAEQLNVMYPVEDDSPALGVPGHAQLNKVAEVLGGEAEILTPADDDPAGTVY
jgi:hypothetical protein